MSFNPNITIKQEPLDEEVAEFPIPTIKQEPVEEEPQEQNHQVINENCPLHANTRINYRAANVPNHGNFPFRTNVDVPPADRIPNTIRFSFDNLQYTPTVQEFTNYAIQKLFLNMSEVISIEGRNFCYYVKFISEDAMIRALASMDFLVPFRDLHYFLHEIPIADANTRSIMFLNVPADVKISRIGEILSRYGEVVYLCAKEHYVRKCGCYFSNCFEARYYPNGQERIRRSQEFLDGILIQHKNKSQHLQNCPRN